MSPADKSLNVWKYETKIKSYFDKDIQTDLRYTIYIVASELKDPIWHSLEWQIGSFSSEATIYIHYVHLH